MNPITFNLDRLLLGETPTDSFLVWQIVPKNIYAITDSNIARYHNSRLNDVVAVFEVTSEQVELFADQSHWIFDYDPLTEMLTCQQIHDIADRTRNSALYHEIEETMLEAALKFAGATLNFASNNYEKEALIKQYIPLQCKALQLHAHEAYLLGQGVGKFSQPQYHDRAAEIAKIVVGLYFSSETTDDSTFGVPRPVVTYVIPHLESTTHPSSNEIDERAKFLKVAVQSVQANAIAWRIAPDVEIIETIMRETANFTSTERVTTLPMPSTPVPAETPVEPPAEPETP